MGVAQLRSNRINTCIDTVLTQVLFRLRPNRYALGVLILALKFA
jgi:hypothetical protein